MKLLLRRDQKAGMMGMGAIKFQLDVRAELTPDEKTNIKKYKLSDLLLYSRDQLKDADTTMKMIGAVLAFKLLNITIYVRDLENGKQIECKDITEMLAAEEQVKQAATTFKAVLQAAATFGGEEVIEIA